MKDSENMISGINDGGDIYTFYLSHPSDRVVIDYEKLKEAYPDIKYVLISRPKAN